MDSTSEELLKLDERSVPRISIDPEQGLSDEQVDERMQAGYVNTSVDSDTHSVKEIIRENTLTYFNLVFVILALLLLLVGSFRNMLFMGVIICNTLIGIVQGIRSKKVLDGLKILNAPKARVVRNGEKQEIDTERLVVDDLILLGAGDQIPADAVVVRGSVQVNEALLTGEADEITKEQGAELMSGSFVISGSCRAQLVRVGADSYISKLTLQATKQKGGEQSEMMRSLDRLVQIVGIIIIPIGILLFGQQFFVAHNTFRESITGMVAAIIGMIPEGLYLTASMALAVSAMRLAKQQVMLHDMKCIETLARVTVLCVDKTGTITEERMEVKEFLPIDILIPHEPSAGHVTSVLQSGTVQFREKYEENKDGSFLTAAAFETVDVKKTGKKRRWKFGRRKKEEEQLAASQDKRSADAGSESVNEISSQETEASSDDSARRILSDLVQNMSADNITMQAMKEAFRDGDGVQPSKIIPFSSRYKYSGGVLQGKSYVLGAPEFVLREDYARYSETIEAYGRDGYRVLAFGEYSGELAGGELDAPVRLLGIVLLANRIRSGAVDTFRYFADRGVRIKVISGDNPVSVSAIAAEAGIEGAERYVDAQTLHTDEDVDRAMREYTVFGRVTPEQKRQFVRILKQQGETVAMTGDGVNDVLALKDADCSIAMASGSEAATQVSQLVLLDSDFSRMPAVVLEGRRVVNNIERTASLFLVKNIFSLLLAVSAVILVLDYPLEASQLSLITTFTIGVPAFLLSQEPNSNQIQGHFLANVLLRALPAGLTDFAVVLGLVIFCQTFGVDSDCMSTACTLLVTLVGFMIMYRIMCPMTKLHWAIWFLMLAGFLIGWFWLPWFYGIQMITMRVAMLMVVFGLIAEPMMRYLGILTAWVERKLAGQE